MPTVALDSLSEVASRFVEQAPHGLLIGGEFSPAAGGRTFETIDPATGEGLAKRAEKAKVGPGLDPDTQFGPVVSKEQHERVLGYIEAGRQEGAEVVYGGDGAGGGRYFVNPTLFTGVSDEMTIAREEIFGPVLVAMPYEDKMGHANLDAYLEIKTVWTNLR